MKISRFILLLGLAHIAHAENVSGSAEKGEQLYYSFGCYSCHGYNATMRVPLVGDASGIMSSEQLFLTYLRLRADQNPINPKNAMPNYDASTLSDQQALDIYAYVKSLKDDSPAVADNAVMQEILESAKSRGKDDQD